MVRWLLLLTSVLVVLGYSIYRDTRYEKAYCGDLRGRVTGARMIKDGRSPYFYKWRAGDGFRYYDPQNFDSWLPSHMTSTPVLYRMLSPLADWPEAKISRWWLGIEYLILAAITLFALLRARMPTQQQAVLLVLALVLLTNGWKQHVANGQSYLFVGLFAMLFLVFWRKKDNPVWAIAAGAAAVCLVGIRFNTVLFFVPFLPMIPRYPRRWLLAFCIVPVLFIGWTLSSPHERHLWKDYFNNIKEATKINRDVAPIVANTPDPRYRLWEGIDSVKTTWYMAHLPAPIYSENANFFVIVRHVLHRELSVPVMGWMAVSLILVLAGLFFLRRSPPDGQDIPKAAILGTCLFMIADLFSPIYRHQYYTVQWILPLMLAATIFSPANARWYWLLLAGLLLNCIHLPFLKMGNTIGEYTILASLLALSLLSTHTAKVRHMC
jgi:hypothetical protein